MSKIKSENLVWFLDELANSESYQFEDGDIEIVVGDENGNEGVTTVTVQDLAASAIQEITSLAEQNKALITALEGLCCSPHTRLTKHVLLEVSEADIDAAIKALKDNSK